MAGVRILDAFGKLARQNTFICKGLVSKHAYSTSSVLSATHLKYDVKGDVAVITFDTPNSKVNVLNKAVMDEFQEMLDKVNNDSRVNAAVLISGKEDTFIAGADINMLSECKTVEEAKQISLDGQRIMTDIEKNPKPVVAAIQGSCLGGGLEVACACHARVAVVDKKTEFQQPEVMLGLLPGAGGTQRIPRMMSVTRASQMLIQGKKLNTKQAKSWGIVDIAVQPIGPGIKSAKERTRDYLEEVAIDHARGLSDKSIQLPMQRLSWPEKTFRYSMEYDILRRPLWSQLIKPRIEKQAYPYPAPVKIAEVMMRGLEKGFKSKKGWETEANAFGELVMSQEANSLMGIFKGQTACKKNNIGTPKKPAQNIAVLGAGLMGAGIAQVSLARGMNVILKDVNEQGLTTGLQNVEKGMRTLVKKKKRTFFEVDQMMNNLSGQIDYKDFKQVDMVIEAVFEDINLKHKVLKEVEQHIPEHCIFASNTSALPIKEIAKGSKRPDKVVGIHYFSPVDKMQLIEVISHEGTSQDTLASAVDVSLRQGKTVIVVKDGPGFYTTRSLAAFMAEAFTLLREGMKPGEMNSVTKKIGFPVGSATLIDKVGIDVAAKISEYLGKEFGSRLGDTDAMVSILKEMVSKGMLGDKSKKGVFTYGDSKKATTDNEEAIELIKKYSIEPKLPLDYDNTRMRLLSRFSNEAVMCLQEGIIRNPLEGDIGLIFGLGFPPFLGGPFRWIDQIGADKLVSEMKRLRDAGYGEAFEPCQLLVDHANESKKFHTV